ncbi:MAG TPA: putative baseplate assembly protein [Devosia sp.]|jgi:hypothetical protein|uniref:putative baseplate assembly protein n=1 Tax=Devosia sp. TaxID=1871048 RepID=UPI002DDCF745|nr:putative baseplate assembly protein [Devosia sp.]HEV2517987.1 putative baseplate assembly protein [Devosia sp.]
MKFTCSKARRLDVLRTNGTDNAIDFLEVLDRDAPPGVPRQQTLFVRLLRPGAALNPDQLAIVGGERIRNIGIVWFGLADALPAAAEPGLVDTIEAAARPLTLVIRTDNSGDHSPYQLKLRLDSDSDEPPPGFDPVLSSVTFSFKVECEDDFDCRPDGTCTPKPHVTPVIDYLAKDYQGFRRLMLDRMSLQSPGWVERSPADIGIALVELLAYAADNLSYRQDAVASEAYLATARRRVSVRRHARLVDYFMHEGCNARAFVHFDIAGLAVPLPASTPLLTRVPRLPVAVAPDSQGLADALAGGAQMFETSHDALLDERLNRLRFYTWGDEGCSLPAGATSATLVGHLEGILTPGSFLILEEVTSPTTREAKDRDRTHRCVVRLTSVTDLEDPSGRLFEATPVPGAVDVTEVSWDAADALPFPVCISVVEDPVLEISVARGNVVLADHGRSIEGEDLGIVPGPTIQIAGADCGCGAGEAAAHAPELLPARYRPSLTQQPLSHGFELGELIAIAPGGKAAWWPARALLALGARDATPLVTLDSTPGAADWRPQRDLLASKAGDPHFVVEVENDGRARLRFGDGTHGLRPDTDTSFVARYRIGNGVAGNVGAEAIAHIVTTTSGVFDGVRNPLPAAGGVDPEDIEAVRRDAPQAFRRQERAVTAADYGAAAERTLEVQRAAASFRWTGSWHTVFVTPDRYGGAAIDKPFQDSLRRGLERFRMAGYDLEVAPPRYVPLLVELFVCVLPNYFRSDVVQAVSQVLSSGILPGGSRGIFHPDNFSFGQPAYRSSIVAAAQAVEGVESVRIDTFQRLDDPFPTSLATGVIEIGGLEIAQLANDPNFRERGQISISAGGGK